MKTSIKILFTACIFLYVLCSAATPVKQYPYIILKPDSGISDGDSVVLQIGLGMAENSCLAPTYEKQTAVVVQSKLAVYPPMFTITVSYTGIPVPPNKICPLVWAPVVYGPSFDLGALKEGSYTVIDNKTTVGSFSVAKKGTSFRFTLSGKVVDDPYPLKRMGLPIPKTKVVLKKYNNIYPLDVVNQPTVSVPFYLETVIDSTVADSLGRFAFKDLAMGTYHVYCTHPDFNPKDVHVAFAKDTSITVIMLAKTAAATVTGTVTVVSTTDGITIVRQPLPGCTVEVSRPMIYYYAVDQAAPAAVPGSLPSVSLRAVTDKNGAYTIAKIPLAYTNESWQVRTVNSGYTDGYESVSLANMRTDTVDFDLQKAYDNSVSDTVDGIIYTVATNKKVYTSGESVWSRYTVFNGTQSAVSFGPFSKNCEYEMTVTSGKTTIFALSDSTECLESLAPVYVKIKSLGKATKSFPAWYPPKNAASQSPLSATPYTIAARFRSDTYNATEVAVTIAVMKSTTPTLPETAVQRTTMVLRRSGNNVFLNLPFAQTVSMIVYRLDGSIEPAAGVSTSFTSGMHVLPVETRRLSAGIYLVKVTAGEFSTAFRVVKADR